MARKKNKVKAAKAREAERLARRSGEETPEEKKERTSKRWKRAQASPSPKPQGDTAGTGTDADANEGKDANRDTHAADKKTKKKGARLRDAHGRKILSESERKKIAARGASRSETGPDRGNRSDAAKGADRGTIKEKGAGGSKGTSSGEAPKRKKSREEIGLIIASHPFAVFAVIVAIVIAAGTIYSCASDEMRRQEELANQEPERTISLVGMTSPAKSLVESTGKFDGFWIEGKSGSSYAELFDQDVTPKEQKVLESRKQAIGEDGKFAYNPKISSAKAAKDEAAQKAANSDSAIVADDAKSAMSAYSVTGKQ